MEEFEFEVGLDDNAEADLDDIMTDYEQAKRTLGVDFFLAVESKIAFLKTNPFLYQKVYKEYRKVNISKFPYSLFFKIHEEKKRVVVIAIWHQKQDFETRIRRLTGE